MGNIVVIGSSNVDMIMKLSRLPKLGETITDGEFVQVFGGKGANQAVAAARAGGNVTFVNCVGEDAYADMMIANFAKDGIKTEFIFKEKGVPSGTALVMIGDAGKNYLAVAPGANYKLTPAHVDKSIKAIEAADMVIIQLEIPINTTKYILDLCQKLNKKVIYNLAPVQVFDLSYLSKVHLFVVNETEAEELTKLDVKSNEEVEIAAQKLLSYGAENVIITLGSEGCYFTNHKEKYFLPSFKVQALDTTAAGDTYCGSLAVALTEGKSWKDAIRFASAASAISVTKLGAQPSVPFRKEIDTFLSSK